MKNIIKILPLLLFLTLNVVGQSVIGKFDKLYIKSPNVGTGAEKVMVWDAVKGEAKVVEQSAVVPVIPGGAITKVPTVGFNPGTNLAMDDWINNTFYAFVPATLSLSGSVLKEMGTSTTCTLTPSIVNNSETIFTTGHTDKTSPSVVELTTWTGGDPTTTEVIFAPVNNVAITQPLTFRSYQSVGNNGTPNEISSNTITLTACFPYLYGMSTDSALHRNSIDFYSGMSKVVQNCVSTYTVTYNSPGTLKYGYYAFPNTCTNISSILYMVLPITDSWTYLGLFDITSSGAGIVNQWTYSYKIYRSNVAFTPASWDYKFNQ